MKESGLLFILLLQFSSILFSQQMTGVKTVVADTIDEDVHYWIYSDLGDTISFKLGVPKVENIFDENTQIFVDDSFFVVVTVGYNQVPLQDVYEIGKSFVVSAGFKSNSKWVQDYVSSPVPYNFKTGFTEFHLDTVEIVNGTLLRVEFDFINYLTDEVRRKETEIYIGAQGFFDIKENRSLTSRWSLDDNFYISNSPRLPIYKLEKWNEQRKNKK